MKLFIIFLLLSSVIFSCNNLNKHTQIGILPYANFDSELIDSLQVSIYEIYGFQVSILESKALPKTAFIKVKSPRYRADSLLRIQHRQKPDSIDYILGLTTKDISFTKRDKYRNIKKPEYKYADWGIFGLGMRPGDACVVSTFRISSINKAHFLERFRKVCIHELGHNFGLKHCTSDPKCVMRSAAETVKTVDYVDLQLCEKCKRKIGLN